MEVRNGMKRTKMLMFGAAGIAAAVLAISIYGQAVASSTEIRVVEFPFSVDIDQRDIELKKGETLKKMVLVESPKDAEFDLSLAVYPYDENLGPLLNQATTDDKNPDVTLDKTEVAISKISTVVMDLAPGTAMKDSGASIIIAVPADATPGSYTYLIEAKSPPDADGLVSVAGKLFTVTVK